MWGAAVVAHFLDAATTHHALSVGDATEANPIMRVVIDRFGYGGMYALKAAVLGWMYHDSRGESEFDREMTAFVALLHGVWPVVNNIAEMRYN